MKVIQQYVSKAGLSLKAAGRAAPYVRMCSAFLCSESSLPSSIGVVASVHQIADFIACLKEEKPLSNAVIKGYCVAINITSFLRGKKFSENLIFLFLFQNYESSFLPRELKPPAWVQSLNQFPCEPINPLSPGGTYMVYKKPRFLSTLDSKG